MDINEMSPREIIEERESIAEVAEFAYEAARQVCHVDIHSVADAYLVAEKEQMPEPTEPEPEDEPPPWPVYEPGEQVPAGTRVMWSHGRGIGGTVVPLNELPFADADGPASHLAILWDDGAEMLMDAGSLAPMTEDGPTPYPEPYPPFVPSDEAPF